MPEDKTVTQKSSSKATVALVLGILSILFAVLTIVSFILGTLAVVFGVLSLKTAGRGKAIAGIITGSVGILLSVIMVGVIFLAVPSLQQNSRDSARRSDVSVLVSEVNYYQTSNMGKLPSASEVSESISSSGISSQMSANLTMIESVSSSGAPTTKEALYISGENCEGVTGTREFSITILLENEETYCLGS